MLQTVARQPFHKFGCCRSERWTALPLTRSAANIPCVPAVGTPRPVSVHRQLLLRDVPDARAHLSSSVLMLEKTAEAGVPLGADARSSAALLPQPKDGQVWYFAYGSNMNSKVLTGRRNVKPLASVPASLDGYVLGFHLFAVPYVEPGMATITPANPTAQRLAAATGVRTPIRTASEAYQARLAFGVHGVLHLVTAPDWEIVKATEGVRIKHVGYQVITVQCRAYSGEMVSAQTLEAAPISVGDIAAFLPSARYIGLIREGAREHGVDPEYCNMLDAHPAYEGVTSVMQPVTRAAVAGVFGVLALPLAPVLLATIAYRAATKALGVSPGPATKTDPASRPAPGAMATTITPSKSEAAMAEKRGTADAQQAAPKPGGAVGPIFVFMRNNLDPRVMSLAMLVLFRGLWLVHDWVLGPLLGSGKDNPSAKSSGTMAGEKKAA